MAPLATSAFVGSLRAIPHLPANSWYYLASVAFAVLNRPAEIPLIYTLASSPSSLPPSSPPPSSPPPPPPGDDDVLNRTREALLKAAAIGGLPSTINALNALRSVVAPELLDAPSPANRARRWNTSSPSNGDMCIPADGGERLWDSIYGKVGPRVMRGMRRSYDDLGAVAQLVYAGVLAPDAVLVKRETGFVLVAGLVTGGDAWAAQLKGHRRYASSPSSSSSSI